MTLVSGFLSPLLFLAQLAGGLSPADSTGALSTELAAASRAETAPTRVYVLPPVRVTAPRPLFPGSSRVLDHRWLQERARDQVSDALAQVAGLRILTLGDGSSQAVSVRGMGPDRTAVLVDGVPRNTAQGGSVDLGTWNLDGVELIQVARGAMGALYGPYALGGAVNLVSRRERFSNAALRLGAGTADRTAIAARGNWSQERTSVSGRFGFESLAPELSGRASQTETESGEIHGAWYPTWAKSLALSLEGRVDDRDVPGTQSFPTPEARRRDTSAALTLTATGLQPGSLPGQLDLTATGLRFERRYQDPGYPLGAVDDLHQNQQAGLNLSWHIESRAAAVTLRTEAARDRLESTTDGTHARDRWAAAGLVEGHRGRWTGSGAARVDAFQGLDPEVTGRVALGRTLLGTSADHRSLSVRAGTGTSFRPPTFDDLFWPARASAAGNPALLPEKAWDLDLGLDAQSGRSHLSVSGFQNEVRDFIQWSPGVDGVWRPHNLSRVRMRGVDLEAGSVWKTLAIDGSLSRLWAHDITEDRVTGGKELVGRPRWTGSARLSWTPGPLGWSLECRGNDRTAITPSNTKWLSGYVLWDAAASWRVGRSARLVAEGRNVLDTDYKDLRGYATPGREFLLSLQLGSGVKEGP